MNTIRLLTIFLLEIQSEFDSRYMQLSNSSQKHKFKIKKDEISTHRIVYIWNPNFEVSLKHSLQYLIRDTLRSLTHANNSAPRYQIFHKLIYGVLCCLFVSKLNTI